MPPVGQKGLVLQGFTELQRSFAVAGGTVARDFRRELREAAEPVRADAEQLAVAGIPRIGLPWARMRVGVTSRSVYVAPRQRGVTSRARVRARRPNLASLLLGRAMEPALDRNIGEVEEKMESLLGRMADSWEAV